MGFVDVLKLIFIPAAIAGAICLLLAYVVVPLYRTHYARYSQYLPVDAISTRTDGLRSRIVNTAARYLLPAHLRWRRGAIEHAGAGEDLYLGEEEGESMVGFDVDRRDRTVRGGRVDAGRIDSERRLSRDLEEGFADSGSEDEGVGDDRRR